MSEDAKVELKIQKVVEGGFPHINVRGQIKGLFGLEFGLKEIFRRWSFRGDSKHFISMCPDENTFDSICYFPLKSINYSSFFRNFDHMEKSLLGILSQSDLHKI